MTQKYLFSFFVFAVFLFLSVFALQQALAEWTDPACPPPGCNSYPPITVGPTPQFKIGNLTITSPTATGTIESDRLYVHRATILNTDGQDSLIVPRGKVGIGTLSPQSRLDVRGDFMSLATTTLSTNPASPVIVGDSNSPIYVPTGKMRVFGNLNIWGGKQTDGHYLELRDSSGLGGGRINVKKTANTQGDLTVLPGSSFGDGGNILLKPGSDSGFVSIGSGGLVNLDVQGNIVIGQRTIPTGYYYTDEGLQRTTTTVRYNETPQISRWPLFWQSNRISCDSGGGTLTADDCEENSYSTSNSSPTTAYDLQVWGDGPSGVDCSSSPPSGNSQCIYTLAATKFTKGTTQAVVQGGALNATNGYFTNTVSAPWYCPEGGDPANANCLFFGGNGSIITPQKLIVGGIAGNAFAGGPENLFVNAYSGTTTTRIGLQTSASGKRVGLYSYRRNGTSDVFGLVASDAASNAGPDSWFINDIGSGNWGLNTAPNNIHTLNVSGKLNATELCIKGVCQPSWPTGGSGSVPTSTSGPWSESGNNVYYTGGNVGVGVSSPDRPLSIRGAGTNSEWISLVNSAGATKWHINHKSGGLNFAESTIADNRFFLAAGGNVGIGTSTPQQKLDVSGNIRATGNILATQYCDVGGANCFTPSSVTGGGGAKHYETYNNPDLRNSLDMNNLRRGKNYAISVLAGRNSGDGTQSSPGIYLKACSGSSETLARTLPDNINWPDGWLSLSHTFYIQVPPSGCVHAVLDGVDGAMSGGGINTVSVAQLD